MTQKGSIRARFALGLAAFAIIASACSSSGSSAAPSAAAPSAGSSSAAGGKYTIGFANGAGTGNGWREASICSAKAQAAASGEVSSVTVIHHDVDAAGQLADIRDLIAKNVNAIVVNPNDPAALNDGIKEATDKGIVVVAIDASVTAPTAYNLSNDQEQYAYLGASWLFKYLEDNGHANGTIWYTRGIAGHPADTDRHTGFMKALSEHPGFKVLPSNDGVFTGWDPTTATNLANEFISSGQWDKIDGVWTSGMDSQVVDAVKAAGKDQKPIVGADLGAFASYLLDSAGYPGLVGAAVTNTAAVGGAGVAVALKLLNGETLTSDPASTRPNTLLLKPVLADNQTDAGKQTLQSWQSVKGLNPIWPLSVTIPDWTHYTADQAVACKGPGE
jgi:ribose transport system substrate-binding protein